MQVLACRITHTPNNDSTEDEEDEEGEEEEGDSLEDVPNRCRSSLPAHSHVVHAGGSLAHAYDFSTRLSQSFCCRCTAPHVTMSAETMHPVQSSQPDGHPDGDILITTWTPIQAQERSKAALRRSPPVQAQLLSRHCLHLLARSIMLKRIWGLIGAAEHATSHALATLRTTMCGPSVPQCSPYRRPSAGWDLAHSRPSDRQLH